MQAITKETASLILKATTIAAVGVTAVAYRHHNVHFSFIIIPPAFTFNLTLPAHNNDSPKKP